MSSWRVWKKWSFLILLVGCGIVILSISSSWEAVLQPGQDMGNWLGQKKNDLTQAWKTWSTQEGMLTFEETELQAGAMQSDMNQEADPPQKVNPHEGDESSENITSQDEVGPQHVEETLVSDQQSQESVEVIYSVVEDDYFRDAVFIGDSRTQGLFEYGGLEEVATFYASTGLTIFKLLNTKIVKVPGQKQKITVEQALSEQEFAKIYLMVGINEMGTGDLERFLQKYQEVVARLKELQPNAIIYLQAIMKVTTDRSEKGDYITNQGIEERNIGIAAMADNVNTYFLDVNPLICNENGGLEPTYTTDGVHLKASYIPIWKDFLKQHAVVLD